MWFLDVGGHVSTLKVGYCGGKCYRHNQQDVVVRRTIYLDQLGRRPT